MGSSSERPLADLLASLSARTPAPGGGSAAGWAGALAAAVLEMVAAFAGDEDGGLRAAVLRGDLLREAHADMRSFEPVLEAGRAPASDPDRQRRLDAALSAASEPPLQIARASAEVAELAAALADRTRSHVRGDAQASAVLAEASCHAAAHLVEINLADAGGDPRLGEVAELSARAASARAQALATANNPNKE